MSSNTMKVILRRTGVVLFGILLLTSEFILSDDSGERSLSSLPSDGCRGGLDMAQDIAVDPEGNVFVTGYSYGGETDFDFVTLKYDAGGNLIWTKRYNGPANSTDYSQVLVADQEGHVYAAGHSNGIGTSLDATLVKYDRDGHQLWVSRYDGPVNRDDWVYAAALSPDGGMVAAGYSFGQGTEHDYLILKYNCDGKLLWEARYNPPRNRIDICETLAVDTAGNVFVTGIDRTSKTSYDMTTLKYNAQGKKKWLARFTDPGQTFDASEDIGVDPQGNVFITGYSYSEKTEYDFVTVKYNTEGLEEWVVKYDGPSHLIDRGLSLAVAPDGGVIVAGLSHGEETAADCLIMRYDTDGNQTWAARYNGPGNGADVPKALALDLESNVIVAGYSRGQDSGRDYFVIKHDAQGRKLWLQRYDGPVSQEDAATAMVIDSAGFIHVTGYSHGGETDFDYATLKYSPDGKLQWQARYQGQQK